MAAESRDRAKRTFLAIMSHEIRTPLNGITGMAELMDTPDLSASQRAKLMVIRDCSDALLDLINDILDFSKLEAGQSEIEIRAFALEEVVETVMDIVAAGARQKGLCLMASYPSLTIATDPTRLRQVMLNLVGNAVKFTDAGDVLVRISEAPARSGRAWLRFEVKDSGVGIPPALFPGCSGSSPRSTPPSAAVSAGPDLGSPSVAAWSKPLAARSASKASRAVAVRSGSPFPSARQPARSGRRSRLARALRLPAPQRSSMSTSARR
jgi:hypothetical protein